MLAAPHLVLFQLQCTLQLRTDNLTARGRAPPQTKRNGNATMHKTDLQLVINPRQNTDLYLMQEDQGAMHSSAGVRSVFLCLLKEQRRKKGWKTQTKAANSRDHWNLDSNFSSDEAMSLNNIGLVTNWSLNLIVSTSLWALLPQHSSRQM